jgi:uncharacterized protein YfaS (alpha-2-macroglobulin family)
MADEPTEKTSAQREAPQAETAWPWLGTRTFWLAFVGVVLLGIAAFWAANRRLSRPDAVVPVVNISGPRDVTPGETVRYAVLVRDRLGAPIPQALVRVGFWKTGLIELGRGRTGDGGDATVEVRFPEDFAERRSLVAVAAVGVADGTDNVTVEPRAPGRGGVFVSTDKPLYQPGQTVHVRALTMVGDRPVLDKPTVIEIKTEDDIKVFRAERASSSFGVVAADFVLADQVKLGRYTIEVTTTVAGDAVKVRGRRSIDVKRYALPRLKIGLEDLSTFTPEGPLRGQARASWIFGEPVTRGTVTVSLERAGSAERSARGQVEKDGSFRFELLAREGRRPDQQPRGAFTLRARVEVEGGIHVETTREVSSLGAGEIKIEAFPESGALVPGVAQTVFVVATHERRAGVEVRVSPDGPVAKTSEQGIARLRVHPASSAKSVKIAAFASDGSEGKLEVPTLADALVVQPDREAYGAGETARVRVLGAGAGDRVALRMTRGDALIATGSCVVLAPEAGCEGSLPVPASVSGLAWVHALSLPAGKRDVKTGKRIVLAGGGSRDLELRVTPDKAIHAPRELGSIDVAVTGIGGAPVKAQLGVAVADEAVFELASERPDLEKIFFTVDRDLVLARPRYRGYEHHRGHQSQSPREAPLPTSPGGGSYEPSAAYDASTPSDVRAAILAALTTMPEVGGFEDASTRAVAARADVAIDLQKRRLAAWAMVLLAALALATFAGFGLYGATRLRRPRLSPLSEADRAAFRLETFGLVTDWLAGVLAPPVLAVLSIAANELFMGRSAQPELAVVGGWALSAVFCAVLLLRAVRRVRRTAVAHEAKTLRRVLFFLPAALFLGHLTILLAIGDARRQNLMLLFGVREDLFFLPLFIVGAAQITSGLLSVVRQTVLRPVTLRGRIWLLASRATFLGLPVTLVALVLLVGVHVKRTREIGWEDYTMDQIQAEQVAENSADNKEGGTGTRAKGEEGSMGNPTRGGMKYGSRGSDDARPPARDFFPETLLWAPEVITDDAGHARIEVPFADSITTWRLGLRAVSREGQLGSAAIPLVVKQDFFVDASLPPVLTQGDELAVPVTVHSYAADAQDVTVEIEGDGVSTVGPAKAALRLAPGEARGLRFTLRADKAGDRVVRVKATSPARADVEERKIIVKPNGLEVVRTVNGRFTGSAGPRVELPDNAIDGGSDLHLKIYGGPLSQVGEGLEGVFQMPHGCFEQTSSTTYPSVLALAFLRRSKAVSPELEKKARGFIEQGYQRLVSFEVSGGGFSLFGKEPASTTLTAYGLLEFSDMAPFSPVDEQLVTRTRDWLYRKRSPTGGWSRPTHDARETADVKDDVLVTAYVAWAIAGASSTKPDPRIEGVLDVVARASGPEADDPYALALRANALLAGGRAAAARPILDRLAMAAVRGDDGVHWTSKAVGVMHSYGSSMEVEVTGLAAHALALAEMQPELRAGALDWLVARRGARGTWSTTQATIAAMRALLDEAKPAPKESQEIGVRVDGAAVQTFTLEPAARDVHRLVSLRRFATTGKHTVELRATGAADVSYQLVATHYLPWQKPAGAALGLEVAYAPAAVPAGSTTSCRVRLTWQGREPARMPLVEVGVPPAFEVETGDLDALVQKAASLVQRYTVERGKVTLYLVALPEDKPLTLDLRLRALRPARVVAPASTAYLYYEPEVRAETPPVLVQSL